MVVIDSAAKIHCFSGAQQRTTNRPQCNQQKASCMGLLDIFRTRQLRETIAQLQAERDTMHQTLQQAAQLDHYQLQQAVSALVVQKGQLEQALSDLQQHSATRQQELAQRFVHRQREIEEQLAQRRQGIDQQLAELNRQVEERRQDVIQLDEVLLLQSFGFYQPRYAFATAEQYSALLAQIRDQQAEMVKQGTAAVSPSNWTVNNSAAEGARMIKDNVKLIVRSFNNECDAAILGVKFNNITTIEKRIRRAFEVLNQLGRRMSISLTDRFLDLKLQELSVAHEYQQKKQEEKEALKQQRAEEREQQKVQREIEERLQHLDKEAKHFRRAEMDLRERLAQTADPTERDRISRELEQISAQLLQVDETRQDVINRRQNTRAGYVYIISNIGAFGEHIYKIGVTRRIEPLERIDELSDASVPFDFDVHALIFSDDAPALELALHRAFEHRRLNLINPRREFFHVTLDEIMHVVRHNFDKPVEVTHLPDAAEYRLSQQRRTMV